jgi:hypothetical protein
MAPNQLVPYINKTQLTLLFLVFMIIQTVSGKAVAEPADQLAEFSAWQDQQQQQFKQYLTTQQRTFLSFLKTKWTLQEQRPAEIRDPVPKPLVAPTIPDNEKPQLAPLLPTKPSQPQISEPEVPPVVPARPALKLEDSVNFSFYGHPLALLKLPELQQTKVSFEGAGLADSWLTLSRQLATLNLQVQEISERLALSDWATYQLYQQYAQAAGLNRNQQVLFIWAAMTELGFDMRIAYDQQALYLLIPTLQPLYEVGFIWLAEQRFYFIDGPPPGPVHVYSKSAFDKPFDFSFAKTVLAVNSNSVSQQRQLTDKTTGVSVGFTINDNLAEYYLNHPQVDLAWYFQSQIEARTKVQILSQFEQVLMGLSQREQLAVLLSFVQHAFDYKLDKDQWGREYYAAPQHTVGLTAVDCEDRSFLFSWLVKNLLDLEVVGLLYPGHVAVAVRLDDTESAGTFYLFDNKKFTITDPTYIGAAIGKVMPDYRNVQPQIINVKPNVKPNSTRL